MRLSVQRCVKAVEVRRNDPLQLPAVVDAVAATVQAIPRTPESRWLRHSSVPHGQGLCVSGEGAEDESDGAFGLLTVQPDAGGHLGDPGPMQQADGRITQ
jgi:hypothetical protein